MKIKLIIALFSLLLLSACSKLNMENYQQLKAGMTYQEVTQIIGDPDSCDENFGTRSCLWGDLEGKNIKANFINEKAIFFSHQKLN